MKEIHPERHDIYLWVTETSVREDLMRLLLGFLGLVVRKSRKKSLLLLESAGTDEEYKKGWGLGGTGLFFVPQYALTRPLDR